MNHAVTTSIVFYHFFIVMFMSIGDANEINSCGFSAKGVGDGHAVEGTLDLEAVDELSKVVVYLEYSCSFKAVKLDVEFAIVWIGENLDSRLVVVIDEDV